MVVCSIPQIRSEIMNSDNLVFENDQMGWPEYRYISYIVYFSFICIQWLLSCFADQEPRNSTYPKSSNPSPELRMGALIKIFYAWFEPMAWRGFRRPLVESDIYDINPENASAELVPTFDENFERSVKKSKR